MQIVARYSDFGAVGDGVANDFAAIKATHDYANEKKIAVEGTAGKVYRLGENGTESITIMTDTLWAGCKFILDDSDIMPDNPSRTTPLFIVKSERAPIAVEGVSSLKKGQENLGVTFPETMLVHVVNSEQRRYIRSGLNQDNGDAQREVLLVHPDGTIDSSTPVTWDYEKVTKITAFPIDDAPVVINGGYFERWANQAPNEYTYYQRGIKVLRSNVTIKNFYHIMIKMGETRAPYAGFIISENTNNLTLENGVVHAHKHYYRQDPGGKNLLGSYEIQFGNCNRVTLKNLYQPNMYNEDGCTIAFKGEMGSNYCRNFLVDGCHLSSFDSHKGSGNITIIGSEIEHINCIGAGHVHIENTVVHLDAMPQIMTLRGDYGCIWMGDAYFKDVTLVSARPDQEMTLMGGYGTWENWDFGYKTCMPHTITLNNVRTSNGLPLYIYRRYIEKFGEVNSDTLPDGTKNLNPYEPVKRVIIESNKYNTPIIVNDTPLFKNVEIITK